MIAVSPMTVLSLLVPLRLSPLGEELSLQEGGRSTTPYGVALPGFFLFASLVMVLTARLPLPLMDMTPTSTTTASLRFHPCGPEGRADVAAPQARAGLRPTDSGACSGPQVGTCRTPMSGNASRVPTAHAGGTVAAGAALLLLEATSWSLPRVPLVPCTVRPRLPARPSITVVVCCIAQAWASSQGGKGRRTRPQEKFEDEEAAIILCAEIMAEKEGVPMGVADLLVASGLATTSMGSRRRKAVRIDVAAIGVAAGSAQTPILLLPPTKRAAVGVQELLWSPVSARTSTAPAMKLAAGEGIVGADFALAPGSATSPMPPNPAAEEPFEATARGEMRVADVATLHL